MTFDEYQQATLEFELMQRDVASKAHDPAMIAKVLGLVGEAGEVAEKFKKIIRDKDGKISDQDRMDIQKELGDVLWYVSVLADYLECSLSGVAQANLDKLRSRKSRGVSRGSGDDR